MGARRDRARARGRRGPRGARPGRRERARRHAAPRRDARALRIDLRDLPRPGGRRGVPVGAGRSGADEESLPLRHLRARGARAAHRGGERGGRAIRATARAARDGVLAVRRAVRRRSGGAGARREHRVAVHAAEPRRPHGDPSRDRDRPPRVRGPRRLAPVPRRGPRVGKPDERARRSGRAAAYREGARAPFARRADARGERLARVRPRRARSRLVARRPPVAGARPSHDARARYRRRGPGPVPGAPRGRARRLVGHRRDRRPRPPQGEAR